MTNIATSISQRRYRRTLLASAISLALSAQHAKGADSGDLEEIVVTATRRDQNVIDVPYNISAISAADIGRLGAVDLQGLTRSIPGLVAPDLGARANSTNSQIIIRGLNTGDQGNSYVAPNLSVPLVSTYIDEVPLFVNMSLSDINRVEILRGPQGTLYGSGAVGGTLRLIHNRPDPTKFTAEISADGSSTQSATGKNYSASGVANIPLADTLAIRFSAGYTHQAGFINARNAAVYDAASQPVLADPADPLGSGLTFATERGIDRSHSIYARASLLWKPNAAFDALFAYQLQRDFSNGFSARAPGTSNEILKYIPNEPITRNVDLYSLTLTADLGFATVISSTSYSSNHYEDTVDLTGAIEGINNMSPLYYGSYPRVTSPISTTSNDRSFVEEVRLVSQSGKPWEYVAGLFYRNQKTFVTDPETMPGFASWSELPGSADAVNGALGTTGTPDAFNNFGDYVQYYAGGVRPSALSPTDFIFNFTRHTTFDDKAVFGELTRHLTSAWQLTGGARVFWQSFAQDIEQVFPICGAFCSDTDHPGDPNGITDAHGGATFQSEIFKLNTSYELTRSSQVYATVSQGFRHGGANAYAVGPCAFCEPNADLIPYRSDRAINYEVGFKGVLKDWLRYSSALYRIDWKDIQLEQFSPLTGDALVINGDTARSQGIELELTAQMAQYWSATLGFGYTDAKLTSDFVRERYIGNAGDRLPGVPRTQISAALDHVQPVNSVELLYHVDAAYRSPVNTTINDERVVDGEVIHDSVLTNYRILGGFTTLNGSVGVKFANTLARLYVQNATNQAGVTAQTIRYASLPHNNFEYVMRPRTFGLTLTYDFP